ncbi:hypothetical protein CBR_g49402 [Chara braunii]|uniref:Uncharacterized protein n=1 Tax=Chara braunii TaxID=69332 RepID=A0A388M567_CHABU|nr:hypothetical protein CBR_g49402 [Chara braunii]|eukprot:GBG89612.1 hypothetical protein CBR_g49402 [Chara braunii]
MSKPTLKAKYDTGSKSAAGVLLLGVGDLRLKLACTDRSFASSGSGGRELTGVAIGVEKPQVFSIDYDAATKATKFVFRSSASIKGKTVKLAYSHNHIHPQETSKSPTTTLESTLVFDSKNSVSGKYNFSAAKLAAIKYRYIHTSDTTLEPSYDFATASWSFHATHNPSSRDTLTAAYNGSTHAVDLEWVRKSDTGSFRVGCKRPVGGTSKPPVVRFEKTWNLS